MRRSGFTLVELLVVIGVIAVLAGMVFPVYAQSREMARRCQCAANLRQVGMAVSMYANDHDEILPIPLVKAPLTTWAGLIQPNLKSWSVFRCPDMAEASIGGESVWRPPLNTAGNLGRWCGYGWNVDYLAGAQSDCSDFDREFAGSGPPAGLPAVAQPSATVMCTGIGLERGPGSWAGRSSLYPDRGGYFLAPAPASVGGTDTCTYPYAGWGAGSYLGPCGGFEAPRHGGRGNVLFVDGHIRSMTPSQLAAGTNWKAGMPNNRIVVTDRTSYLWDLQ